MHYLLFSPTHTSLTVHIFCLAASSLVQNIERNCITMSTCLATLSGASLPEVGKASEIMRDFRIWALIQASFSCSFKSTTDCWRFKSYSSFTQTESLLKSSPYTNIHFNAGPSWFRVVSAGLMFMNNNVCIFHHSRVFFSFATGQWWSLCRLKRSAHKHKKQHVFSEL